MVDWHSIGSGNKPHLTWHGKQSDWQCIGWFKVWQKSRILPKSRPLIGRELWMLASYWSRGLSENLQRGYPYNPEPLPMDGYWGKLAADWIDWWLGGIISRAAPQMFPSTGSQVAYNWILIGIRSDLSLFSIGIQFNFNCYLNWSLFYLNWLPIGS